MTDYPDIDEIVQTAESLAQKPILHKEDIEEVENKIDSFVRHSQSKPKFFKRLNF